MSQADNLDWSGLGQKLVAAIEKRGVDTTTDEQFLEFMRGHVCGWCKRGYRCATKRLLDIIDELGAHKCA